MTGAGSIVMVIVAAALNGFASSVLHAGFPERAGSFVPRAAMQDAIMQNVQARTTGTPEDIAVEFTSVPDSIRVSGSGYTLHVDVNGAQRLRGNVSAMLEVRFGDRIECRVPVSFTVRTHAMVLTASKPLGQHATPAPEDDTAQWLDTTLLPSDFLVEAGSVTSMRTRRMIAKGSVLYASLFESLPIVMHGDAVTLKVRRGLVVLSMPAIAKEDGRKGEIITVQKLGAHERIRAKVEDARTVELALQ